MSSQTKKAVYPIFWPAAEWTRERRKQEQFDRYYEWRAGVTDEFLSHFIQNGLAPFLKFHGYQLIKDKSQVLKCLRSWAYGHVQIHRETSKQHYINYTWCAHENDPEASNWFNHCIPFDAWEELTTVWHATEFLDTSEPGTLQREDLATCVWHLLDLNGSSAHQKYVNTLPYEDSDDEQYAAHHHEESQAFGGDRRTH